MKITIGGIDPRNRDPTFACFGDDFSHLLDANIKFKDLLGEDGTFQDMEPVFGDYADFGEIFYPGRAVFVDDTFEVEHQVEARSTAKFSLLDVLGEYGFEENQPVKIYDDDGTLLFGGFIDSVAESQISPGLLPALEHEFECKDNHYRIDKRKVYGAWKSTEEEPVYGGDIVRDLITDFWAAEGITIGEIQDGPEILECVFNYTPGATAMDRLAEECGFTWFVAEDSKLYFIDRATYVAPFAYTPEIAQEDTTKLTRSSPEYRNQQIIRGAQDITSWQTESFVGDGQNRSFTVARKLAEAPELYINEVRVDPDDIGTKTQAEKSWYWALEDNNVTQDSAETALAAGDPAHAAIPWAADTEYEYGDIVQPLTPVDPFYVFMVSTAQPGLSGNVEPTWPTKIGDTARDGSIIWTCQANPRKYLPDILTVRYKGYFDILALSSNFAEIELQKDLEGGDTSGIVEEVEDRPEIRSRQAAIDTANAKLKQYAQKGRQISYQTLEPGLAAGQLQPIYLLPHDLDGEKFLINRIRIRRKNNRTRYEVEACEGPVKDGWIKIYCTLFDRAKVHTIRENTIDQAVVMIAEAREKVWTAEEDPNPFKEVLPGAINCNTPGWPCLDREDMFSWVVLLDAAGVELFRKQTTKRSFSGDPLTTVTTIANIESYECNNVDIAYVAFYSGYGCSSTPGSGYESSRYAFEKTKNDLEAFQITSIDVKWS